MQRLEPSQRRLSWQTFVVLAALVASGIALDAVRSYACPFCSAVALTLTQEIESADLAVLAKLAEVPKPAEGDVVDLTPQAVKTKFTVVDVLKGAEHVKAGQTIEVFYFGQDAVQPEFLITAIDPKAPSWGTPIGLSEKAGAYVRKLLALPAKGADRLAFFQDHFEDPDPILAGDAYDEFAKAPYSEIQELGPRMHHDKLLGWIQNPEITPIRKRLYLTMLGVCGTKEDVPVLAALIQSNDRETRKALDAIVACYLILEGPNGLPLVEDLFLKNQEAEYTDTYAVIMALRFHGQEVDAIPRERLVEAMRHMLGRPELADLVIADLARWEDWGSMERLVELFKDADEESGWVRVPVVNFLRACPLPEAKVYLAELEKIDPDAVKRANNFLPLPGGGAPPPAPVPTVADDAPPAAGEGETEAEGDVAEKPAEEAPAATEEKPADTTGDAAATDPAAAPAEDAASTDEPARSTSDRNASDASIAAAAASGTSSTGGGSPPTGGWSWPILAAPLAAAVAIAALLLVILRPRRPRLAT